MKTNYQLLTLMLAALALSGCQPALLTAPATNGLALASATGDGDKDSTDSKCDPTNQVWLKDPVVIVNPDAPDQNAGEPSKDGTGEPVPGAIAGVPDKNLPGDIMPKDDGNPGDIMPEDDGNVVDCVDSQPPYDPTPVCQYPGDLYKNDAGDYIGCWKQDDYPCLACDQFDYLDNKEHIGLTAKASATTTTSNLPPTITNDPPVTNKPPVIINPPPTFINPSPGLSKCQLIRNDKTRSLGVRLRDNPGCFFVSEARSYVRALNAKAAQAGGLSATLRALRDTILKNLQAGRYLADPVGL